MMLEKYLIPDKCLPDYSRLLPEDVVAMGVKALICDIDNTLVTYDDKEPTPPVLHWLEQMNKNGIKIAFVSNNGKERVEAFNKNLDYIAYAKAGKPKIRYIKKAMKELNCSKSETALLGDQLLTDCAAAKMAGIKAVIVPPIKDKTTLFFKLKRLIEKPYMKKYRKIHKENW